MKLTLRPIAEYYKTWNNTVKRNEIILLVGASQSFTSWHLPKNSYNGIFRILHIQFTLTSEFRMHVSPTLQLNKPQNRFTSPSDLLDASTHFVKRHNPTRPTRQRGYLSASGFFPSRVPRVWPGQLPTKKWTNMMIGKILSKMALSFCRVSGCKSSIWHHVSIIFRTPSP